MLVPMVREAIDVPLDAPPGHRHRQAMLAAMVLGADGVQLGSRFVCSEESSAHPAFKQRVVAAGRGDRAHAQRNSAPVRSIRNLLPAGAGGLCALRHDGAVEGGPGSCPGQTGHVRGDLDEGNWRSVR